MDIFRERLRLRLQWAKDEKGLTQEAVATRLGVSRRRLNNWLNTGREPTLETFAELCRVLEMSPCYCLGFSETPDFKDEDKAIQRLEGKIDKLMKSKE